MKLLKKLQNLKNTIYEDYTEYNTIKDLTASEIAQRYGYTQVLQIIHQTPIINIDIDENIESLETRLNIKKINEEKIQIIHENIGEKEVFNLKLLKYICKKDGYIVSFDKQDPNILIFTCKTNTITKEDLEEKLKVIYEHRQEYFNKAEQFIGECGKNAGEATKKSLKRLSNWADTHL